MASLAIGVHPEQPPLSLINMTTEVKMQDQGFDFFELPKELRDAIYSNLTNENVIISGTLSSEQRGIQVIIRNTWHRHLLGISKQFVQEYKDQLDRVKYLTFRDLGGTLSEPKLFSELTDYSRVELDLLALCTSESCSPGWCDGVEDVSTHSGWTESTLAHFPRLEDVVARLYVHWKPSEDSKEAPKWPVHGHGPGISEQLEHLVNIPKLSRLEVYPFFWKEEYEDTKNRAEIYEQHGAMVAAWSKREGWLAI